MIQKIPDVTSRVCTVLWDTGAQISLSLKKRDRGVAEFTQYGVEKITEDAVGIDKTRKLFPAVADSLESPDGPVHMLVGMDHMKDAPRERARGKRFCAVPVRV
jgi:hypothetical protein